MSPRFRPAPNQSLSLFGEQFIVQPHQQQPAMTYAAEGKAALVYKLKRRSGHVYALKVFKKQFRSAELIRTADRLRKLQSYEGLRAAERQVVEDSEKAAQEYPELLYAMLMPWIAGTTWNDLLIKAGRHQTAYDANTALQLCRRFLAVMQGLESSGIAHTDIAPGNVIVNTQPVDVQLLDLEDVFIPGFPPPAVLPRATPGYDHPAANGHTTWSPEGDRYSAAVMAAEMLLLPCSKLAATATDAGLFGGNRTTPQGKARFPDAYQCLESISPAFAQAFKQVWNAKAVKECPKLDELRATLANVTPPVGPQPTWQKDARASGPVTWVPRPGSVFASPSPQPPDQPVIATPTKSSGAGVAWTGASSTTTSTRAAASTGTTTNTRRWPPILPWVMAAGAALVVATLLYILFTG